MLELKPCATSKGSPLGNWPVYRRDATALKRPLQDRGIVPVAGTKNQHPVRDSRGANAQPSDRGGDSLSWMGLHTGDDHRPITIGSIARPAATSDTS